MRRIDTPTAAQDLFGPGKHGFRNGDPANAVLATRLNAEHFNAIQEEIAGVIEGAGSALNPANNGQLFAAIKSLFRSATLKATEALLGVLRVGTQVEVDAGALDDVAVTPKKLRWGFVLLATSNGYLLFPSWMGSFLIQWGNVTAGTGSPSAWPVANYVIPFTTVMLGCFSMHTGSGATSTVINFIVDTMANSLSQFRVGNSSASTAQGRYIAIGI